MFNLFVLFLSLLFLVFVCLFVYLFRRSASNSDDLIAEYVSLSSNCRNFVDRRRVVSIERKLARFINS